MVQFTIFWLYDGAKVICIINYMRYSTLYYKRGFLLDDFAQLQAHRSVLGIFKIGCAKL